LIVKFKSNYFEVTVLHVLFASFIFSYLLFFLRPIFFEPSVMVFPHYVPEMSPKGADLRQMMSYSDSWLLKNGSPYIGNNLYPPLATVLFSILLSISFEASYRLISVATVSSFIFMTAFLPLLICKKRKMVTLPIITLICVTGLTSYGLQFEIERGQFNVIAMFFCFLSLWIWHQYKDFRVLAYILFIISVQLKVFPLIFMIMFVDDWTRWIIVLRRFLLLVIANFLLFFVLGVDVFFEFISAIKLQAMNPYIWWGNHSVMSFVQFLSEHGLIERGYIEAVKMMLYGLVVCCLIISIDFRRTINNYFNATLFFTATIATMLIPSVSHDYKLSILPPAFSLFVAVAACKFSKDNNENYGFLIYLMPISFLYFSSMYSYAYRIGGLQNSAVYLIFMMVFGASLRFFKFSKKFN
jgi:Glycosyltransferase family 87